MAARTGEGIERSDSQAEAARVLWQAYLTGDKSHIPTKILMARRIMKLLPTDPRCKVCNAPFSGIGSAMVRPFGFGAGRSSFNHSLCNRCEKIVKKHQVGIELQLTMLFADVRDSTTMAEETGPTAFHQVINRYYQASTEVLSMTDALVNRLIGDAMVALYVPGIAGPEHAGKAVAAARALLGV